MHLGLMGLKVILALVALVEHALVGMVNPLVIQVDEVSRLVDGNLGQRLVNKPVRGFEVIGYLDKSNKECEHGSRTMMSDKPLYLRLARCSVLESRRQPVRTEAVQYNRVVIRNAVAEDSRDGELNRDGFAGD